MLNIISIKTGLRLLGLMAIVGLMACQPEINDQDAPVDDMPDEEMPEEDEVGEETTLDLTAEGREFYIDGEEEENPDLVVQEGSMVEVTLCVTGGTHDWVVDEFDAATDQIGEDDECSTVSFVADQVGEFEYYCSVGNHREEGMYGTLIVEEEE
ncbi:hypothetical protein FRE64_15495 [Euhalothece natronophila Z-M001]|uniref:Blue (type 1) copper domain-containing protein n=1 Tax=Euhalothece natronophila Z-M001 TaxID=522448 RepID=A0A5B8NPH0_9CHRO|nr:cupredoxin domain-containing protein [Euhalothece natronophila]QDZ41223.1 hypothetical protein FRE64_15495 [Euhalothece natronophila Z-M001]